MAECLQGGARMCASACLSAECVWFSRTCFHKDSAFHCTRTALRVSGVPHALACVPTPRRTLFDFSNVNRCCTTTGSGWLLRSWWKRSCSSLWQRAARRSLCSRKQQTISHRRECSGDGGLNILHRIYPETTVSVKHLTTAGATWQLWPAIPSGLSITGRVEKSYLSKAEGRTKGWSMTERGTH